MEEVAIRTEGLTKRFGGVTAVDSLNLTVPRGSVYALLGPNGAGKTTTLKLLLGLVRPTAGKGGVLGFDIERQRLEILRRIGYVAELPTMYGYLRVEEMLDFARGTAARWDRGAEKRFMSLFGLPRGARVASLSRGTAAQLAITVALSQAPELLLLDEPTVGLDPRARREFLSALMDEVAGGSLTVLISSHSLWEIERIADRVGIMRSGRLLFSRRMDELKLNEKKVRAVFQAEIEAVELASIRGVNRVDREGAGYLLTVGDDLEGVLEAVRSRPHFIVEVVDLSLEDIFLRYTEAEGAHD